MLWNDEKRWKSLWSQETRPRHAHDNDEFYRSYSKELLILIGEDTPAHVLEIGCGTGALYPYLKFDTCTKYLGVDVSAAMLEVFKARHPAVNVILSDGESYRDAEKYDLIFSNGVIQNFSRQMLDAHLAYSKEMLHPQGRVIAAMIPWGPAHFSYCSGTLLQSPDAGLLRYLKLRLALWRDGFMGRWYDHNELASLGKKHGLKVKFHGSLHYPYRIHAVFQHAN
jgi:cyclopropane fatty-acyl-phospholipid synthase-like methyltransferase